MNITLRKPTRKSMLGTRRSVRLTETILKPVDIPEDIPEIGEPTVKETFKEQLLRDIDDLLKKNSDSFKALQQEREELQKIERLLNEKLDCSNNADVIKKNDNNFTMPQLRSKKIFETPKPSVKKNSIIQTPRSRSFCIQKQIENLLN